MKIGLYPGCSFEGSAREYAESLWAIAPRLGLELEEVETWACCGSSSAHNLDHKLSLMLPAGILAQAEKQKMDEVVVPCAACFSRLASAKAEIASMDGLRRGLTDILGMPYAGTTGVRNILEVLLRVLTPEIVKTLPDTFPHKVACYYGCLLVRPKSVTHEERIEDPMEMDELMKRIGARPLDWAMKTECCGASFSITRTKLAGNLSGKILEDAVERGAEAIIVACPMCHSNLDMRRKDIERATGKKFTIPILYVTQAIGLALGLTRTELGLQRHFVPVNVGGNAKPKPNSPVGAKAAVQ
jgi:heterodisulfide reductase subunit B